MAERILDLGDPGRLGVGDRSIKGTPVDGVGGRLESRPRHAAVPEAHSSYPETRDGIANAVIMHSKQFPRNNRPRFRGGRSGRNQRAHEHDRKHPNNSPYKCTPHPRIHDPIESRVAPQVKLRRAFASVGAPPGPIGCAARGRGPASPAPTSREPAPIGHPRPASGPAPCRSPPARPAAGSTRPRARRGRAPRPRPEQSANPCGSHSITPGTAPPGSESASRPPDGTGRRAPHGHRLPPRLPARFRRQGKPRQEGDIERRGLASGARHPGPRDRDLGEHSDVLTDRTHAGL